MGMGAKTRLILYTYSRGAANDFFAAAPLEKGGKEH